MDDEDDEFRDLIMALLVRRMFVSRRRGEIDTSLDCTLSSPLIVVMTGRCPLSSSETLRGILIVVEPMAAVEDEESSQPSIRASNAAMVD
jgi:hypothetical protein